MEKNIHDFISKFVLKARTIGIKSYTITGNLDELGSGYIVSFNDDSQMILPTGYAPKLPGDIQSFFSQTNR